LRSFAVIGLLRGTHAARPLFSLLIVVADHYREIWACPQQLAEQTLTIFGSSPPPARLCFAGISCTNIKNNKDTHALIADYMHPNPQALFKFHGDRFC
jgi:hypothetical protein